MKTSTILIIGGIGAALIMAGKSGIDSVVNTFALAIQKAEGFFPGSWSYRTNNPGNITDMGRPGQIATATNPASGITFPVFDSYESGFAALVWKIKRAFTGASSVYSPDMSIADFFQTYSGDANEAENVARALGVTPDVTLKDLIS